MNASTIYGPSWSVRRHGRSSQCGTRGFLGSNTLGPSWSVRRHGRSSQCGTRGFPWLTANPQHTFLVPPGVCGSWPLLQCGTRGLLGLTANPQHLKRLEHQTSAVDLKLNQGFVPRPHPRWGNGHSRAQWET